MSSHQEQLEAILKKYKAWCEEIAGGEYIVDRNDKLGPTATFQAITALIQEAEVGARIDQINQIRHSDVKLNHGTIELMGYMSQQLNKKKLQLSGGSNNGKD